MISLVSVQGAQVADFNSKIRLYFADNSLNEGVSNFIEILSILELLNAFPKINVLFLPLKLSLIISNKSYGTLFTINKIGVGDGLDSLTRCLTPLTYFPIIKQTKILSHY